MKQMLILLLQQVIGELGIVDLIPQIEVPTDLSHGDYTSNVAMVLAKKLKRNPIEIAEEITKRLKIKDLTMPTSRQGLKNEENDQFTSQIGQKTSKENSKTSILQDMDRIEVVPPGFINFYLSVTSLGKRLTEVLEEEKSFGMGLSVKYQVSSITKKNIIHDTLIHDARAKRVMVEFAHPNTHKAFHIGHLRNISTGESIVRLLENQGIEVVRANYQGDVGMHIAKALYGIQLPAFSHQLSDIAKSDSHKKIDFLGKAYAAGSKAYEESDKAKKEIGEINKKIYVKNPEIFPLYQTTRQWSLDYFEKIYKRVGSHYDRYYFESECYETGKANTLKGLKKGIFEKSDGAIIFPGGKFGLHNRVFITSEGNPTYEGKDMGLGPLQFKEYNPDLIIHVVGPEQAGYFQVVFEALAQLFPETRGKEYHLIYGWVKLKHGKMSSRSGVVVLGEWLIDEAKKEIYSILERSASKDIEKISAVSHQLSDSEIENIAERAAIAAVKYSFLKVSTKQEIAFDLKESVSFEGDSGPYLQYTYARCKSVLRKASHSVILNRQMAVKDLWRMPETSNKLRDSSPNKPVQNDSNYNSEELSVMRTIYKFPEVVKAAADNYAPNILCKYLYDLASAFNTFYNKHSILGSVKYQVSSVMNNSDMIHDTESFRLALTAATAQVIKNGLYLLGIETLERM